MYLLYIYIYIYPEVKGKSAWKDPPVIPWEALRGIGARPGERGGGQGERERTNRRRAPQKFEQAVAQLHSVASVTHRRCRQARSGIDRQATTFANPRSQDNSVEARERAVPPRHPPAARRATEQKRLPARCLRLAQPIAPVRSLWG